MKLNIIVILGVLVVLALSACGNPRAAAPAASAGCPDATVAMRVLKDADRGFCLQYPREYQVVTSETGMDLIHKSPLNVEDPRLGITVVEEAGSTVEQAADKIEADFSVPGMDVERSTTTIAGETAIVLDNLPGQDLNRRVVFVHDGALFELFFTPIDRNPEQFEAFYDTIVASFTFPSSPAELVVQSEEQCPMAGDGEQVFRYDTAGYCFVHPAEYTVEDAGTATNFYVGSMMDVEHPKLFVEVLDAAGRSAEQVAEQLITDYAPAGYEVDRPFGLLLGGEPAALLNNMPGQDISRQVVAVNGERAYRLTFLPADPTAGDVYAEMEALYDLVTDTFTFLPVDAATVADMSALVWEGPALSGADCASLVITADGQTLLGACGAATTPTEFVASQNQYWAEAAARFAPFEYSAGADRVVFRGTGTEVAGPAWQRAIATWARYTEAELASGRVSASARTVLSWWLGEISGQAGYCKQLVVLNFGYAYANVSPCDGNGETTLVAAGWIDTSDWEQFDAWLYSSGAVSRGNDYFAGAGSETLSADDIDVWAQNVYARLTS